MPTAPNGGQRAPRFPLYLFILLFKKDKKDAAAIAFAEMEKHLGISFNSTFYLF